MVCWAVVILDHVQQSGRNKRNSQDLEEPDLIRGERVEVEIAMAKPEEGVGRCQYAWCSGKPWSLSDAKPRNKLHGVLSQQMAIA